MHRNSIRFFITLVFFAFSGFVHSQKLKWTSPDFLLNLKSQKTVNVVFTYKDMEVGKFPSEEAFLKEKCRKYDEDQPGKGTKFKESWMSDKHNVYEPIFLELLTKHVKNKIVFSKDMLDARYTMIVHTTFMEPGFNVGIMKNPAYCNFRIKLVETQRVDSVLTECALRNVMGSSGDGIFDYAVSYRVKECYAKAGKMIGKDFAKVLN